MVSSMWRHVDDMTEEQLKAEALHLDLKRHGGKMTPREADRLREIRMALKRIHSTSVDRVTW